MRLLGKFHRVEQASLVEHLRQKVPKHLAIASSLLLLLGVSFQITWTLNQRSILEDRARNAIAHTLQEPIRNRDLIAIKRTLQAFSLANPEAEICLKLPGGVDLEQ